MATDGKTEDEFLDFTCTLCHEDGNYVNAIVYCEECRERLCDDCYKFHQRFRALSAHTVLDTTRMQTDGAIDAAVKELPTHSEFLGNFRQAEIGLPESVEVPRMEPTDTCDTHAGKLIVVHCTDHDVPCCVECVKSGHRTCSTVYTLEAAAGFKHGARLMAEADSTKQIASELDEIKTEKETELKELLRDLKTDLAFIKTASTDIVKRIKELEKASENIVKRTYGPVTATLEAEIKYFEGLQAVTQSDLNDLGLAGTSEIQLFTSCLRTSQHNKNARKALRDISQKKKRDRFLFSTRPWVNNVLASDVAEGLIEQTKAYVAKLIGNYNIKASDDQIECNIAGSCQLRDGTFLITDWTNLCIKRLDASYCVIDHCNLYSQPWGVTCTSPDEAAVTLTKLKKVQFVSMRDLLTMTRSFTTFDKCRGIFYADGQLYVACGDATMAAAFGYVATYNLEGVPLYHVRKGPAIGYKHELLYHITVTCVTQCVQLIVVLDKLGKLLDAIPDPKQKHIIGVCLIDNGNILVCDYKSNNVLQFDGDGRKVTELLTEADGILKPMSICFDSSNTRLIVTMGDSDIIKVFSLK